MPRKPLRDIVVIVPGITGSVLRRDDTDVWALSGQALWRALRSHGGDLRELELRGSEDGVEATALMRRPWLVPGLLGVDGYGPLVSKIEDAFEIVCDERGEPLNLIEFPYDWRRDNRIAAAELGETIEQRLPRWRQQSGAADAKVVVLAHSMGGLVARHWIECGEGWRKCSALITFGTPHRGAPNTIGYLANGYRKLGVDLTEAMRSFRSVHQLLPRYPALDVGGDPCRVAEVDDVPGVNAEFARDGLAFHREIEDAVTANNREHGDERYVLVPVVGARQPTIQSARLEDGRVSICQRLPAGIDPLLADGDGTVPRLSAIPIELSDSHRDTFVSERHGSLQVNESILADICERLVQLQVRNLGKVRSMAGLRWSGSSALAVEADDAYTDGEPVEIGVRLLGDEGQPGRPEARIAAVGEPMPSRGEPLRRRGDDGWGLVAEDLRDGLYRFEVGLVGAGPWAPPAVHGLFGVARTEGV